MARRRNTQAESRPPTVAPHEGAQLLIKQLDSGKELLSSGTFPEEAYSRWETLTRNYLEMAFGSDSANVRSVMDIGKYGGFPMDAGEAWWARHRAESLNEQLAILDGLIELLMTEAELQSSRTISNDPQELGHRIFVVHGHNDAVLHGVARFMERLGQEIVILREQPNQGRTIIEKFEEYSDVGFAVVLLTPDDVGGKAGQAAEELQGRARQNVIFELGYFIGKLGRRRVCALYLPEVEVPSDYSGVLFILLDDSGGWRLSLAKELKAAGLAVDMNKAI